MQISLKNVILAAALAAVPTVFAADTGNQVNAGGDCNEPAVFKCVSDGSAVAVCSQSKWISLTCPPGTVCRDNFCQWPAPESTTATVSGEASASDGPAAESFTTSAVLKDQEFTSSAEPTSETDSSSSKAPEATSSPSQGDGELDSLTCDAFSKAVQVAGYPAPSEGQCKSFLGQASSAGQISSLQEAAMFLSEILWESDGLRAKEEYACADTDCRANYPTVCNAGDSVCEANKDKDYHGRGYIQLTWYDNYKAASEALYGDDRLVESPDTVAQDEDTAWAVSFWYWADRVRSTAGVLEGKFGAATKAINGALECNGGGAADKAKKRFAIYEKVFDTFGLEGSPDESGCY
ncbi:hypothetical protein H4R35_001701 [Dimargaris xerosporica]|nr:hypothetical protein H4R35_001701 [Dimargaris xerosporica]